MTPSETFFFIFTRVRLDEKCNIAALSGRQKLNANSLALSLKSFSTALWRGRWAYFPVFILFVTMLQACCYSIDISMVMSRYTSILYLHHFRALLLVYTKLHQWN